MKKKVMKELKKHGIRVNPDLDQVLDKQPFAEKVEAANTTLDRVGLPKGIRS